MSDPRTSVKVCGITSVEDALACIDEGVNALGVNFWNGSARRCDEVVARAVVEAVHDAALVVAVFVDATLEEIKRVRESTGIEWVQLHGAEPPELVAALLPHAYKAFRLASRTTLDEIRSYPGEHILVDAFVHGQVGGTGQTTEWDLAAELAPLFKLTLAGGLTHFNVAEAIGIVRPYRVDVASGVESAPGVKDRNLVKKFMRAVQSKRDSLDSG